MLKIHESNKAVIVRRKIKKSFLRRWLFKLIKMKMDLFSYKRRTREAFQLKE